MKKLISILLVIAMLASFMVTAAFAAETAEADTFAVVSAGHKVGTTGDTVNMQVWIDRVEVNGVRGYRSFAIRLDYDKNALKVVGVNGNVTANTRNEGIIYVSFASATLVELGGADTAFSVDFQILAGPGDYPVQVTVLELYGDQGVQIIPDDVSNGNVHVWCSHVAGNPVRENEIPATCGEDGSYNEVVYCTECGEQMSSTVKVIPATGKHTAGNPVRENEVPATCKVPGSYEEVVYCSVCEEELSRTTKTIPVNNKHVAGNPVRENEVPATCGEDGSYEEVVYCSVCDVELSRTPMTIPATDNHTAGNPVRENEVPATCKVPGSYEEVVYCSVCDVELSRTTKSIPVTEDHVAGNPVRENEVAATCGEDGSYDEVVYCSVCNKELSRTTKTIPATGKHTYDNGVVTKEPTCTEKGEKTFTCTVCGHFYTEDVSMVPHNEHYIDNNDGTHDVVCEACDKVLHDNEKCFDVNPEDGKCDGCGYEIPEEPTTKPTDPTTKPSEDDDEDDDVPKTGDITPYPVYFLIALMAVVATTYGLKRKFDV